MLATTIFVSAEDGSQLWLRYGNGNKARVFTSLTDATSHLAKEELTNYWDGQAVKLQIGKEGPTTEGGFRVDVSSDTIVITAQSSIGLLYGTYDLLRVRHSGVPTQKQQVLIYGGEWTDWPRLRLRILNHWDNLDGSIERGYAGKSILWNDQLSFDKERLLQYARANASIGINGAVLNNVNASPQMLSRKILRQVKTYADILRPYGIRVFLSVNFATPMHLSKLKTADPMDSGVRKWWADKTAEIYKLIPDFGGFLVKANSENQLGPGDYGRTHAEGANMLAQALKPYGGIVMWRSFVYSHNDGSKDRVMQALEEFKPLDGQFDDNVILQSKNGPLDFQPREPYAPIFTSMQDTKQMAELQITQEYTGQSIHLAYLATMWNEFFQSVDYRRLQGIAGVANIGQDTNYCGHHFSQANWYAFGRLAWNPELYAADIAMEWMHQTFTTDKAFTQPILQMMMESREACVDYMMPLGLHHIFQFDHHYGPNPGGWQEGCPIQWCMCYYDRADSTGLGFDRSSSGSNAVSQYPHPYDSIYNNLASCPEEYLLWFHHVPWDYRLRNGLTLMDNLRLHYDRGVRAVESCLSTWQQMQPLVDQRRWQEVDHRLHMQLDNARLWRTTCLGYYGGIARQTEMKTNKIRKR